MGKGEEESTWISKFPSQPETSSHVYILLQKKHTSFRNKGQLPEN
jgi:hypothetical protein